MLRGGAIYVSTIHTTETLQGIREKIVVGTTVTQIGTTVTTATSHTDLIGTLHVVINSGNGKKRMNSTENSTHKGDIVGCFVLFLWLRAI